jgi:predicted Zn-dependent protease with MMP-like domain
MGAYAEAERDLERARRADPTHPDVLHAAGEVHLGAWRIDRALEAFRTLSEVSPSRAVQERLALCHELRDEPKRAERALRRGHALEPELRGPCPRLTPEEFETVVQEAVALLPDGFREAFAHVALVIDPVPAGEVVVGDGHDTPPDLLGLFVGAALIDGPGEVSGELPPRVYLFQRNIEREVDSREALVRETRVTLYHELGHALGFDEQGVEDMGLG